MSSKQRITRREFLKMTGLVAAGTTLAACVVSVTPKETTTTAPATVSPTAAPTVATARKVQLGILEVNKAGTQKFLDAVDFKGKTGLDYEIVTRSDTHETEL